MDGLLTKSSEISPFFSSSPKLASQLSNCSGGPAQTATLDIVRIRSQRRRENYAEFSPSTLEDSPSGSLQYVAGSACKLYRRACGGENTCGAAEALLSHAHQALPWKEKDNILVWCHLEETRAAVWATQRKDVETETNQTNQTTTIIEAENEFTQCGCSCSACMQTRVSLSCKTLRQLIL